MFKQHDSSSKKTSVKGNSPLALHSRRYTCTEIIRYSVMVFRYTVYSVIISVLYSKFIRFIVWLSVFCILEVSDCVAAAHLYLGQFQVRLGFSMYHISTIITKTETKIQWTILSSAINEISLLTSQFLWDFSTSIVISDSHLSTQSSIEFAGEIYQYRLRAYNIRITFIYLNIFYQRKFSLILKTISRKWPAQKVFWVVIKTCDGFPNVPKRFHFVLI